MVFFRQISALLADSCRFHKCTNLQKGGVDWTNSGGMYVRVYICSKYMQCAFNCIHKICIGFAHAQMYVCMFVCMYGWMHGCMDGWMYVSMYVCMYVCRYGCMDGCMDGCI